MDIPEDVLAMADKARIYDRQDYQVIAEWARKQTLEDLADDLAAAHSPGWSNAYGPIVYTDYDAGTTAGFDEWLRARALGGSR